MDSRNTFDVLEHISKKPAPFETYTTPQLWTEPYVAQQMLKLHLDPKSELASRNAEFVEKSTEWIIEHFEISENSRICDFGCGPGLYTTRFVQTGAHATGIDFSRSSIDYAKQVAENKEVKINYIIQDYLQFSTDERFNLITMIYCDFCTLNPAQRAILLQKWANLLEQDGSLLIDLYSDQQFKKTKEKHSYEYIQGNGFWSPAPHYAFLNTFKYEPEQLLLDKWTIIEADRTREIFNWLQCYTIESLRAEFEAHGLAIVEYYADISGALYSDDSPAIAIIARKN